MRSGDMTAILSLLVKCVCLEEGVPKLFERVRNLMDIISFET